MIRFVKNGLPWTPTHLGWVHGKMIISPLQSGGLKCRYRLLSSEVTIHKSIYEAAVQAEMDFVKRKS
jgi:hypothetical protein